MPLGVLFLSSLVTNRQSGNETAFTITPQTVRVTRPDVPVFRQNIRDMYARLVLELEAVVNRPSAARLHLSSARQPQAFI